MGSSKRPNKVKAVKAADDDHSSIEQQIRDLQKRLEEISVLAVDWLWEQDENFRFTAFSGHLREKGGRVPNKVIGKCRWDMPRINLTPEDWARHKAQLERHEPFFDFEMCEQREDGSVFWVSSSGMPVFDADGRFKGYRGIGRNITDKKLADEALKKSEARFRHLTELSSDWLWEQDENLRFTFFSRLSKNQSSPTNDAFIGKYRWDTPKLNLTEEDWAKHKAQLERHEPFFDFEMLQRKSDGSVKWSSVSGVPIFDENGRFTGYRGIGKDITAKKLADQALRDSETRFRDLTELSSDWYWEMGPDLRFTHVHAGHGSHSQFRPSESIGKYRWELPYVDVPKEVWDGHKADLAAHRPFYDLVLKRRTDDGNFRYVSLSGKPLFDAKGVFIGYRGVGKDITERKASEERIQYLATHDSLTGLPNRSMFSEILNLEIESARRYNRHFSVFFIDLDRFKNINDTFGHEAGDLLLKEMSKRLKESLRASDVVARLGGDEFVVLVQEVGEEKQVSAIARKVLSTLIKPMNLLGQECRVTASIGVCMFPQDAQDEQALMKNADIAMYRAKEEGKNNFQFYSAAMNVHTLERMVLETSLRQAMDRNEFFLNYQAKLDLKSGAITGVEALLRWQNKELGSVSPAQFIPLAEETGLIVPIGKWVLRTACEQNVKWQREGLSPLCMAVNLSPRQFADDELLKDVESVLKDTGMRPELLELEITEGIVMQNPERAIRILTEIKKMGVRLAIDDFGVGYSSLAQIKRFPIDTLKVDRSFIREIPQVAEDNAITEAIIAMGKTLSLTVIAEGVETMEQKQFLREHECDEMQGFHFSKPIGPEQFADLVRKHVPKPE
jgi:diguanylate cyclase (GGDEF)-like protein/PAS domain S-box-containing protein